MGIKVVYFRGDDGAAPVLDWLSGIKDMKARTACFERMEQLKMEGHRLRRPASAPLRDGIHELRAKANNVHYRILYGYSGTDAVLLHGCTKTDTVDPADIDRAVANKRKFDANPKARTYERAE